MLPVDKLVVILHPIWYTLWVALTRAIMFIQIIKSLIKIVAFTAVCAVMFLASNNQVIAEDSIANQISFSPITNDQLIDYYAAKYDANPTQLKRVMKCESSGNQLAIGDGGRAVGLFQFHQPTWDSFSKKLGEKLDRTSSHDQIKLAAWAFSNGYSSHWSCK